MFPVCCNLVCSMTTHHIIQRCKAGLYLCRDRVHCFCSFLLFQQYPVVCNFDRCISWLCHVMVRLWSCHMVLQHPSFHFTVIRSVSPKASCFHVVVIHNFSLCCHTFDTRNNRTSSGNKESKCFIKDLSPRKSMSKSYDICSSVALSTSSVHKRNQCLMASRMVASRMVAPISLLVTILDVVILFGCHPCVSKWKVQSKCWLCT